MTDIHFVDTTIRDGHQSLWAERMSTGMMLPIAKNLNDAGFVAIELLSGSHIKKAVRELREDPWERIKRICALCPDTPMRLIAGPRQHIRVRPALHVRAVHRAHGRERHPAGAHLGAVERSAGLELPRRRSRASSALDPIVNLIYSVSPVHTDEYYAERCRQAVTLKPFRLCLKDPGGLAHARARAHAGAGDLRQRRRHRGRAAQPLHHGARSAGRARGGASSASASSTPACRRSPTARRCRRSSTSRTICARSATRP